MMLRLITTFNSIWIPTSKILRKSKLIWGCRSPSKETKLWRKYLTRRRSSNRSRWNKKRDTRSKTNLCIQNMIKSWNFKRIVIMATRDRKTLSRMTWRRLQSPSKKLENSHGMSRSSRALWTFLIWRLESSSLHMMTRSTPESKKTREICQLRPSSSPEPRWWSWRWSRFQYSSALSRNTWKFLVPRNHRA